MHIRKLSFWIFALAVAAFATSILIEREASAQVGGQSLATYEVIPTGRPNKGTDYYSAFKVDRKLNILWACHFEAAHPKDGVCRKISGGQRPAYDKSAIAFMISPPSVVGSEYWLVNLTDGAVSVCGTGASAGGEADCVALKDSP
jgi:hypothetical protein